MGQSTILTGPFSIAFCMFTRGYGNHGSCGKTTAKVGSKFWSVVLVILGFLGMVLLYIWFTTLSIYYINYIILLFYFILYCIILYYIIYISILDLGELSRPSHNVPVNGESTWLFGISTMNPTPIFLGRESLSHPNLQWRIQHLK